MHKEKKKHGRITLSPHQFRTLMAYFKRSTFPDAEEREHLATQLNITSRSVQIWFQNQRQKMKMNTPVRMQDINNGSPYEMKDIISNPPYERDIIISPPYERDIISNPPYERDIINSPSKGKTLRALSTAAFIEYCRRAKFHRDYRNEDESNKHYI